MRRHALTDAEWARLRPLLPARPHTGRPPKDHRGIIDALFWLGRSGAPWRDLPERFGPWHTVATRFYRWTRIGLWDRILAELRRIADVRGGIDWAVHLVDGTSVRAHRCAAGGKGGASPSAGPLARRLRQQAARPVRPAGPAHATWSSGGRPAQGVSADRDPLRQAGGQLPRLRPARRDPALTSKSNPRWGRSDGTSLLTAYNRKSPRSRRPRSSSVQTRMENSGEGSRSSWPLTRNSPSPKASAAVRPPRRAVLGRRR